MWDRLWTAPTATPLRRGPIAIPNFYMAGSSTLRVRANCVSLALNAHEIFAAAARRRAAAYLRAEKSRR